MSVTNPDNENSGMTEYERERIALEERKVTIKVRLVTYLLWFFFGWLMVHRMYLGHYKSMLLCWSLVVITLVSFIVAVSVRSTFFGMLFFSSMSLYAFNWIIIELFLIPKPLRNKIEMARTEVHAEEERRIWKEKEEALRRKVQAEQEPRIQEQREQAARLKAEKERCIWKEKEDALRRKVQAEEERRIREQQEEAARLKAEEERRVQEEQEEVARLKAEEERRIQEQQEEALRRMDVTNRDNETSAMTEYHRRMVALEEGKALRHRMLVAYLLWFFLAPFLAHRLYINANFKSVVFWFIIQVVGYLTIIFGVGLVLLFAWFIRWIVDLFIIPQMLRSGIEEDTLREIQLRHDGTLQKDAPAIKVKSKGEDYVIKG